MVDKDGGGQGKRTQGASLQINSYRAGGCCKNTLLHSYTSIVIATNTQARGGSTLEKSIDQKGGMQGSTKGQDCTLLLQQ